MGKDFAAIFLTKGHSCVDVCKLNQVETYKFLLKAEHLMWQSFSVTYATHKSESISFSLVVHVNFCRVLNFGKDFNAKSLNYVCFSVVK